MEVQVQCPECNGAGRFLVTIEMAIDAGDRSMAGEWICVKCNGAGHWIEEIEDNSNTEQTSNNNQ